MSTLGIVAVTVILTCVAIIAAVVGYYLANRESIEAEQARVQAALRAWSVAQTEQAADQAIRLATRAAVEQMMREARNQAGPK